MIVSPTEPKPLLAAATKVSMLPETFGADIAIRPHTNMGKGWIGVQRKEVKDLVASMMDGRLVQQIAQLESCLMAFIVIEGRFTWTIDGMMMNAWKQEISKSSIDSLLLSIMMRNVHVVYTTDVHDTIKWCLMMEAWARKPEHTSLDNRPGPDGGVWGRVDSRAWSKHLLMGFPGIGSKLAGAIIDHFGGVPLDWSTPVENLMKVPGIGKGKAETLIRALQRKEEQGE